MNDKLRQWIEAEIKECEYQLIKAKRFFPDPYIALKNQIIGQQNALELVLQKDKEITDEPNR